MELQSSDKNTSTFIDQIVSPTGIGIILFCVVIISAGAYIYARRDTFLTKSVAVEKKVQPTPFVTSTTVQPTSIITNTKVRPTSIPPTKTPTSRPIKDIPGGKQVYNVSNGPKVVGPKIQQITLDPQIPSPKDTQTVTITVKHDSPVTEATAYVETDNTVSKYPMKLIQGTTTDGTWQGSWKINDTYNYNYYIRFDLKSATGEYNNGIRLR